MLLNEEARELINLYAIMGDRAANILPDGYITVHDLARGRISEKVNQETVASAKFAVCQSLMPEGPDNHKKT